MQKRNLERPRFETHLFNPLQEVCALLSIILNLYVESDINEINQYVDDITILSFNKELALNDIDREL